MTSSNGFPWTWSPPHQDYYYATTDQYGELHSDFPALATGTDYKGNLTYHWYKQEAAVHHTSSSSDQPMCVQCLLQLESLSNTIQSTAN